MKKLEDIAKETGPIHKELNGMLDRFKEGNQLYGQVYERTVLRMIQSGVYSKDATKYYMSLFREELKRQKEYDGLGRS